MGELPSAKPIRVGLIGLDTSHVLAFPELLRQPDAPAELATMAIVAGYPGGNPDFPLSRDRVADYTRQLRESGLAIHDSLDALLEAVDAVMLESVDGSQHLAQAAAVFAAGKPVFIDKPLAASLADAVAIDRLARWAGVPWFTSSSSRFTPGYAELRQSAAVGQVLGCDVYSQSRAAPGHPDLYWYGVHGVDLLYTILGRGCETVAATQTPTTESVRGVWADGRVGTYRGIRELTGQTGLGATVFGSAGIVHQCEYYDYRSLVVAIARFFETGQPPVSPEEAVEVFAYLEAAEESKRRGGSPVTIATVMAQAQAEAESQAGGLAAAS